MKLQHFKKQSRRVSETLTGNRGLYTLKKIFDCKVVEDLIKQIKRHTRVIAFGFFYVMCDP